MKISVDVLPFSFPNYLPFDGPKLPGGEKTPRISVAEFDDNAAADYWNAMLPHWLAHVRKRRENGGDRD